jgi:hypothetical protein
MTPNPTLWQRLEAFQLDDPDAPFRFSDRLARENGWSAGFARRAVEEYKKFVYLAAVTRTPVTPSDIVDQVWHLHLTFTRSYWDEMCAQVLGKPLHHGPTKGGTAEDARYRRQYEETLALYGAEFGVDAPPSHWPSAEVRFDGAAHQRWIDRRTHWILRKPSWRALIAIAALAGGAGTAHAADGTGGLSREVVIGGLAVAALLLFAAISDSLSSRRKKSKDEGSGDGGVVINAGAGGSGGGKGKGTDGEGADGGDGGSGCGGGGCGSS